MLRLLKDIRRSRCYLVGKDRAAARRSRGAAYRRPRELSNGNCEVGERKPPGTELGSTPVILKFHSRKDGGNPSNMMKILETAPRISGIFSLQPLTTSVAMRTEKRLCFPVPFEALVFLRESG